MSQFNGMHFKILQYTIYYFKKIVYIIFLKTNFKFTNFVRTK